MTQPEQSLIAEKPRESQTTRFDQITIIGGLLLMVIATVAYVGYGWSGAFALLMIASAGIHAVIAIGEFRRRRLIWAWVRTIVILLFVFAALASLSGVA